MVLSGGFIATGLTQTSCGFKWWFYCHRGWPRHPAVVLVDADNRGFKWWFCYWTWYLAVVLSDGFYCSDVRDVIREQHEQNSRKPESDSDQLMYRGRPDRPSVRRFHRNQTLLRSVRARACVCVVCVGGWVYVSVCGVCADSIGTKLYSGLCACVCVYSRSLWQFVKRWHQHEVGLGILGQRSGVRSPIGSGVRISGRAASVGATSL